MIRYALQCDHNHEFESWFQNSAAYDKQAKRSLVTCPVCGSAKVDKAIMAPRLAQKSDSLVDHADMTAPQPSTPAPNPRPGRPTISIFTRLASTPPVTRRPMPA